MVCQTPTVGLLQKVRQRHDVDSVTWRACPNARQPDRAYQRRIGSARRPYGLTHPTLLLMVEGKPRPPQQSHASQEQNWQRVHALLSGFTITCGADITRRRIAGPCRMLAMSVGTDLEPAQSCISTAMEQ